MKGISRLSTGASNEQAFQNLLLMLPEQKFAKQTMKDKRCGKHLLMLISILNRTLNRTINEEAIQGKKLLFRTGDLSHRRRRINPAATNKRRRINPAATNVSCLKSQD